MLINNGIGCLSEQPIICKPCGSFNCHHNWIVDIILVQKPVVIEIHRPKNDDYEQSLRKQCLENDNYEVLAITAKLAMAKPETVLEMLR